MSIEDLCRIVGPILSEYIFDFDPLKHITEELKWLKYSQILSLKVHANVINSFVCNCLRHKAIKNIHLNSRKGDLSPLRGAPIQTIYLKKFTGDLSPLHGAPIQTINLKSFTGDISPLREA